MDLLAEQLNEYSRQGIPRLPHLLTFEADEDTEEALYRYISFWTLHLFTIRKRYNEHLL